MLVHPKLSITEQRVLRVSSFYEQVYFSLDGVARSKIIYAAAKFSTIFTIQQPRKMFYILSTFNYFKTRKKHH